MRFAVAKKHLAGRLLAKPTREHILSVVPDTEVSSKIVEKIEHLGEFLGAIEVEYTAQVPKAWKDSLR